MLLAMWHSHLQIVFTHTVGNGVSRIRPKQAVTTQRHLYRIRCVSTSRNVLHSTLKDNISYQFLLEVLGDF
jgi:hypothetical protein